MNHDALVDRALNSLEKTLVTTPADIEVAPEGSPLFQACSALAEKMGFTLPRPLQANPTIEEICTFANIRYRRIELHTDWWKQDHGHFIAWDNQEKKPVALLFTEGRKYALFDPQTGKSTLVDEKIASTLSSEAIALYPPLPAKTETFRGIFGFILSKNYREYVRILLVGIGLIVLGFAFPVANKILYDFVIPNYNLTVYTQLFLGLLVIVLSSTLFMFSRSLLMVRIKGILTEQIQIGIWDRLLRLPISFFRSLASGDLLLRTLIFEQIKNRVSNSALAIILNGIFSFFYLIMMLIFSWQLALIGAALIFAWGVFAFLILLLKIRVEKRLLASTAEIQSFLVQAIQAIHKVRSAVLENRIFAKWGRDFALNQSLAYKALRLQNLIQTSSAMMGVLLPFCFYSFIIYMKSHAENPQTSLEVISVGTFLAFLAAFTPFSQGLLGMVVTATSMTEIVPFWKRAKPLLTAPLEKVGVGADPGILKGKVAVQNLHFRYSAEGPLVLRDVNLKMEPGELVGLVGKTGCGKSTLCRLLFGFEQVAPNTIFIDDQDITEMDLTKLRKQIGFLFQENKIFNGNIYDNITCGRPCTKQQLDHAIALTTFDQELAQLPMGLDTRLSSIGGLLSGGQKQKLLLARTLLLDPQMLIIDEGLNTLDNTTQQQVLNNIKGLHKTTLLTTHRLNILESADRIYVMDEGTIIADGTFPQLSHQEGIFKRFYEKQVR